MQKFTALWIVFEPSFLFVFGTVENHDNAIVESRKNFDDDWFIDCNPVLFCQEKHRKDWWLRVVFSVREWERLVVHLFNEFTSFILLLFRIDCSIFHLVADLRWLLQKADTFLFHVHFYMISIGNYYCWHI